MDSVTELANGGCLSISIMCECVFVFVRVFVETQLHLDITKAKDILN